MHYQAIIGVALWALIPGSIAKRKGRSFWGYYFLSFLITPLICMIVTLCLKSLIKEKNSDSVVARTYNGEKMGAKVRVSTECCISNLCPNCKQVSSQTRTISGEGYGEGKGAKIQAENKALEQMQTKISGLMEVKGKELLPFIESSCSRCNQLYPWIRMDGGYVVREDYQLEPEYYPVVQISNDIKKKASTMIGKSMYIIISVLIVFMAIIILFLSQTRWFRELKYKEYTKISKTPDYVYADIIKIVPTGYQLTKFDFINYGDPEEIICKCRTEKGKNIWVVFSVQEYYECIDNNARLQKVDVDGLPYTDIGKPQYELIGEDTIKYDDPLKIYGRVVDTGDLEDVGVTTATCIDFSGIEPE